MKVEKVFKVGVVGAVLTTTLLYPTNLLGWNELEKEVHVQAAEVKSDAIKLVNGDFEEPIIARESQIMDQSLVPGWHTEATDGQIEIMRHFEGNTAAHGNQWAEMNANSVGALYQDLPTTPGKKVRWSVSHRSRGGTDVAEICFGNPNGNLVLQQTMSSSTAWKTYTGTYIVPEGQSITRFEFKSVSSGTGVASGNWVDNVIFSSPSELVLTGQFSPQTIKKDDTSTYQLSLKNNGGLSAANNQVSIQLPKEVSYIENTLKATGATISGEQYDANAHKMTLALSDIEDSAEANITLDVKGEQVTTGAQATASVSYQDQNFNDETYQATSNQSTIVIEKDENPVITGLPVTLKVGDKFDPMSDMKVTDKEDGDLTSSLKVIDNPVDTNKVGVYTVKYQVTDSSGNVTNFERKVTVRTNEKPVITGEQETNVKAGRDFDKLSKMKATDKEDGDLTSKLIVTGDVDTQKVGDYTLTYTVTDSDKNTTTFTRIVHVVSNEKPVITGEKETSVKAGRSFDPMLNMKATDKEDGNLTSRLKVDGKVDTSVVGDYTLTYTVTDNDGNSTIFTRIVHILSNDAPTILGEAEVRINPNTLFDPFEKMTATDKEDGDLTAQLKMVKNNVDTKVPGTYEVGYEVTDSDGNVTTFTKTVIVTNGPTIEAEDQTIQQGDKFDPLKYVKAADKEDGNLTQQVKVKKSDVNSKSPGLYHVTYEVTDSDGNRAEKTIQVTVTSLPKPATPATPKVVSSPGPVVVKSQPLPKTGDQADGAQSTVVGLLIMSLGALMLRKKN